MASFMKLVSGIGSAIVSLFNFIVDFFADLLYMITLLVKFIAEIPSYFTWLPAELVVLMVSLFGLVFIYMVLGRK